MKLLKKIIDLSLLLALLQSILYFASTQGVTFSQARMFLFLSGMGLFIIGLWIMIYNTPSEVIRTLEVGEKYAHFKGNDYIITGFGTDTETLERTVIYVSLDEDDDRVWLRSERMFNSYIKRRSYKGPRFKQIVDEEE